MEIIIGIGLFIAVMLFSIDAMFFYFSTSRRIRAIKEDTKNQLEQAIQEHNDFKEKMNSQ